MFRAPKYIARMLDFLILRRNVLQQWSQSSFKFIKPPLWKSPKRVHPLICPYIAFLEIEFSSAIFLPSNNAHPTQRIENQLLHRSPWPHGHCLGKVLIFSGLEHSLNLQSSIHTVHKTFTKHKWDHAPLCLRSFTVHKIKNRLFRKVYKMWPYLCRLSHSGVSQSTMMFSLSYFSSSFLVLLERSYLFF